MKILKTRRGRDESGATAGTGLRNKIGALLALGMMFGSVAVHAEDAETIVNNLCVSCHGADGNGVIPAFPKLAGLQREYLTKQLNDYLNNKRRSDVMAPQLAALKRSDIPGLAAYYSALQQTPGGVTDAALAARGKQIFEDGNENSGLPACGGCHRPDGAGTTVYPRLAGQNAEYIVSQLQAFKTNARSNDLNRFMRVVGQRMTDEEMAAVAQYISGLTPQP